MGWNRMGWDGIGWDGIGWDGMEWNGMGWDGMGLNRMGWNGMGWDGLGWVGLGWVGMWLTANMYRIVLLKPENEIHIIYQSEYLNVLRIDINLFVCEVEFPIFICLILTLIPLTPCNRSR